MRRRASPAPDELVQTGTERSFPVESKNPGSEDQGKAAGYILGMALIAILSLIGGGLGLKYGTSPLPWALLMAAAGVMGFLGFFVYAHASQGYVLCRDAYRNMARARDDLMSEASRYRDFLIAFPVDATQVTYGLERLGTAVGDAHRAKVEFYREARGAYLAPVGTTDLQIAAETLRKSFSKREQDLEKDVQQALEEFRAKRDLANGQGYSVKESWKDYDRKEGPPPGE